MLENITNALKHQAKNKINDTIDIATNEVKSQYKFAMFIGKTWMVLGTLLLISFLVLAGTGIYAIFN